MTEKCRAISTPINTPLLALLLSCCSNPPIFLILSLIKIGEISSFNLKAKFMPLWEKGELLVVYPKIASITDG